MIFNASPIHGIRSTTAGWGFFIYALVLLAPSAHAQRSEVGVKGGVNAAYESFHSPGNAFSIPPRLGACAGLYAIERFKGKISLQFEVVFSRQGGKGTTQGVSVDDKLSYLIFPLLCNVQISPRISLHAGPQYGYLLSASSFGFDVRPSYNRSELAAAAGVTFDLWKQLSLGIRFTTGLTSTNASAATTRRNQVGQIVLAYPVFKFSFGVC